MSKTTAPSTNTRSPAEVNVFGNKLNLLVSAGKISNEEQKVLMTRYKRFEIDDVPNLLGREDIADETACLTRDGEVIPPLGLANLTEKDDIFSESESDEEAPWPTVAFIPGLKSLQPQPNGKVKTTLDRMDDVIKAIMTLQCSLFAQPGVGIHSFNNETEEVQGPFIRPNGVKFVSNDIVLEAKDLMEFLMKGRRMLMIFQRKYKELQKKRE